VVKIWQLIWGPLAAGPSHSTTGTMVNPALSRSTLAQRIPGVSQYSRSSLALDTI